MPKSKKKQPKKSAEAVRKRSGFRTLLTRAAVTYTTLKLVIASVKLAAAYRSGELAERWEQAKGVREAGKLGGETPASTPEGVERATTPGEPTERPRTDEFEMTRVTGGPNKVARKDVTATAGKTS